MYARRRIVAFDSVNLNAVILGMYPLLRRLIGDPYELVIAPSEPIGSVSANASQVEQVLLNLVVNARDAMPEGGRIVVETANVTLDADYAQFHPDVVPGDYVMFTVSDTGVGIPAEIQKHIFEPFFTTKDVGQGTGLGLATCYGIVKQSGGSIGVYSEPGQGTIFKVCLPRLRTPLLAQEETLPAVETWQGTETILLVDDDSMVRDITARNLRAKGYRVLEANNGIDAIRLEADWKGPIDLLLSDVMMPLMGGKDLAEHLQKAHPDIKVLYMSGYTNNVVLHQGVLESDNMLLTKPFTSTHLLQKVRETLNY